MRTILPLPRSSLPLSLRFPVVLAGLVFAAGACGKEPGANPLAPLPQDTTPVLDTSSRATVSALDLRFKGVGRLSGEFGYINSALPTRFGMGFTNIFGTPLQIGGGGYWLFRTFFLPVTAPDLSTIYWSDTFAELPSHLAPALTDTVITSLDWVMGDGFTALKSDTVYALSELAASGMGRYALRVLGGQLAGLQDAATQEGARSRVITAVIVMAGQTRYLSYGWEHDTTTVYDAQVATATLATVASAAQGLAAGGYTITAFGGDPAVDSYVLVGTRVHGITAPRDMLVATTRSRIDLKGYAVVGYLFDPRDSSSTMIAQK